MNAARPAWRTPTGAMLWEIWSQHNWAFGAQGVAFIVGFLGVYWKRHGASDIAVAFLTLASLGSFGVGYLKLLTAFGYIETNARLVKMGYPVRLLLKPVNTTWLALVPMFVGGAIAFTVLTLWIKWVLQPLGIAGGFSPGWLGAVTLSFFWWMQALSWSVPLFVGRSLIVLLVMLIHFGVGLMGATDWPPVHSAGLRWGILLVLLLSAIFAAINGLKLMRSGTWEGPSRLSMLWFAFFPAQSHLARKKFNSAFRAQFWLEWRRQGLLLPGMCGVIVFTIVPVLFLVLKKLEDSAVADPQAPAAGALATLVLVPLAISGALGTNMARFDQLQNPAELPVYIAVRPMTNGSFVLAKLAMALASSLVTWLLVAVAACFWTLVLGRGTLFSTPGSIASYGPFAFAIGCLPAVLFVIIFTWKNLVAGMASGLAGRPWLSSLFIFLRMAGFFSVFLLAFEAKIYPEFGQVILRWLTWLLATVLTLKVALSVIAFSLGLRRNAITRGVIGWIAGGWMVCGLFVAGYAGLICNVMKRPDLWLWIALAGFLTLPLTDLAVAPLAFAWNRHR